MVAWRRRHADFPALSGGTDVLPQFGRPAVVAWLLAHDRIEVPVGMPSASLTMVGPGRRTVRFRLDGPHLALADDAEGADELPGWSTDADADELAALAAGEFGAALGRLTAPGTVPLAVLGRVRVVERFRSGSGGLRVTLAWPAGLRGAAARNGGVAHHAVLHAGAGAGCGCVRHACGGVTAVSWCPDHGPAEGRAAENHIEGGVHCVNRARPRPCPSPDCVGHPATHGHPRPAAGPAGEAARMGASWWDRQVCGAEPGGPAQGPRPGHDYVELSGGLLDGLLLDVTGWPVQEVVDGELTTPVLFVPARPVP
ncbi:hypothetical protein ACQKM2_35910 [Streptomyces sp. NPDC004126]|uniref:hypothetical protein n=1 Tax=Streptomyces sp. NPDC004126 TaxID=3390695 RepID=UPI003CFCA3A1